MDTLVKILERDESAVLRDWIAAQTEVVNRAGRKANEADLQESCRTFLAQFRLVLANGLIDQPQRPEWEELRNLLGDMSRSRAKQGFSPSETATFVFSLKRPLFDRLRAAAGDDAKTVGEELWRASQMLDHLGLYTIEVFQHGREEVIMRQQQELLELSTPVVELWDGIVALPLIGTLDSARTQVVMENLLQKIVDTSSSIAIIDITGVPTVDTLVAQHLLKTVAAARLMGADCLISGIRPQIAQTIVHLGLELNVTSKATLSDAFAVALQRLNMRVVDAGASRPLSAAGV
jgi:rsbT co-antagonist protein RsbR